jgi:anaerobic selenocysteine-containing dehydrogenase
VTTHHSSCPLDCPDAFSLDVEVVDDRVTRVRGSHAASLTDGFIWAKVGRMADHLYGPERVRHPLIRTGPKGSGTFRKATWDEALTHVADRLATIRDTHGGDAEDSKKEAPTQSLSHALRLSCGPRAQPWGVG